ncbi:SAM-dependent methyltransferase [Nibricoccus sp. IMCC34717]|uniref:SAM-dependent methyltransferase n=1 Tax=Nibricoccus sp. IMCC34717 TaxID=3034021 RepID=UPI00384F3560
MLIRCQPGFEALLGRELGARGIQVLNTGGGWVTIPAGAVPEDLCFAHDVLIEPREFTGDSVNAIAGAIAEYFLESARNERFEAPWPFFGSEAAGLDGLGRRAASIQDEVLELVKRRIARVAKLAEPVRPHRLGRHRGLALFAADFKQVFAAREWHCGGQRRMADDPLAPSRSYLKIEEAYNLIGLEPDAEDSVADLGAAPGGWSYSAAKRRARVVAVDNGPLKGGALGHALIDHRREDAFKFQPAQGQRFDWLFCDLVEEPHHVLRDILEPWILHGWCRRFVVILKFGRVDPLELLDVIRDPQSVVSRKANGVRVRHLYHDREEFTLVGEVHR